MSEAVVMEKSVRAKCFHLPTRPAHPPLFPVHSIVPHRKLNLIIICWKQMGKWYWMDLSLSAFSDKLQALLMTSYLNHSWLGNLSLSCSS